MQRVFIYPGSDHVFNALFEEARNMIGIEVVDKMFVNNSVEKKIHKYKSKKNIWKLFGQYYLYFMEKDINKISNVRSGDILVFSNISICNISLYTLRKIKENGVKIALYFIDSISNVNAKDAFGYVKKGVVDVVYTYDKKDADMYGFSHFYTMYSDLSDGKDSNIIEYDLFFSGSNKGRYEIVKEFIEKCSGLRTFVNMINISDDMRDKAGFNTNKSIDYFKSVDLILRSNCILDIVVDPKQSGLSLRAYEAITYNKKLITNNPSILEFPFYNPKFMKYVKDVDDFDILFVSEVINVDYGYTGEYSPRTFVSRIIQDLS